MEEINSDSKTLTDLGNNSRIRHYEITKNAIDDPNLIDYLFYRLYNLMVLLSKGVE